MFESFAESSRKGRIGEWSSYDRLFAEHFFLFFPLLHLLIYTLYLHFFHRPSHSDKSKETDGKANSNSRLEQFTDRCVRLNMVSCKYASAEWLWRKDRFTQNTHAYGQPDHSNTKSRNICVFGLSISIGEMRLTIRLPTSQFHFVFPSKPHFVHNWCVADNCRVTKECKSDAFETNRERFIIFLQSAVHLSPLSHDQFVFRARCLSSVIRHTLSPFISMRN